MISSEIRTRDLLKSFKDGEIVSRDRIDMKIEEIEPIEEEIGSLKAGFQIELSHWSRGPTNQNQF